MTAVINIHAKFRKTLVINEGFTLLTFKSVSTYNGVVFRRISS